MATLVLAAAGAAIGGSIGGTLFGVSAAVIGRAAGGLIGNYIDQSLFGGGSQTISRTVSGPRLDGLDVQKSAEGGGLPVVEGRGRVAGQIIWSTRLEEETITSTTTSESGGGGKGGGGGGSITVETTTTEYRYYANFAVALTDCTVGRIRHFGRIWADGKLLDTSNFKIRYYYGTETQNPDPLIVAKDGAAPAYRGVAYVVFERMRVDEFGRRLPNLAFEVFGQNGTMETLIKGVDIIPGATEFGYSPSIIKKNGAKGSKVPDNAIRNRKTSDWNASMSMLGHILPNADTVALIVSWFGDDLRTKHCNIAPRVERRSKNSSRPWTSGGRVRSNAILVSHIDGRPAFGSSPDDQSIIDAIRDLKSRGKRVVLYPFIMLDIPAGNTLPDRDGNTGQSVYPWRGRIGPAAADGSVASQVSSFMGSAQPGHYSGGSGVPNYSGPNEWSYRRFILHLAALARNAGGVDAFLIGTEMVDLTTATDQAGVYPFVNALTTLAGDVNSLLPSAKISYAADWSEYHSHRNGGEVYFHLDPLWSSSHVDFIGIDNYLPISDWRAGTDHADYDPENGVTSVYSLDYLKSQIEGGEYWDYYYASEADRATQTRTPIFDGAHGEDWIFRQKAIRDWQSNAHHNRPGGVRNASSTSWVPGSKPVWFTEFGCPAIDLGSNQPNVFYDPKSSESFLPHFSSGNRDDFMQRQYIRAMIEWWRDNGGSIVSDDNMMVWAWDSRPWPEFPQRTDTWTDGPNWRRGHWLNGRAGSAPAQEVLARRLKHYYGIDGGDVDLVTCYGQADGMMLPEPLSFREVLATWETALRLDASEHDGVLKVGSRSAARLVADFTPDDLVEAGSTLYNITRTSQEETPRVAVVKFADTDRDYQSGAARASIRERPGQAEASAELAIVSDLDRMTGVAEMILRSAADDRESVEFALPPSSPLKPGEVFTLTPRSGATVRFIANQVTRGEDRKIKASLFSGTVFGAAGGPGRPDPGTVTPASESAEPYLMDLPILPGVTMDDHQGLASFVSKPWPGGVDLYRSSSQETGYSLNLRTGLQGTAGETVAFLPPGKVGVWSGETLEVELFDGAFISRPSEDVLNGANALALEHSPGNWEVLQYRDANLVAENTWHLTGLLRGQMGTEWVRDTGGLATGARIVALDAAVTPVAMRAEEIGRPFYWRASPSNVDQAEAEEVSHTFRGIGRRPLSPCHLKATVSGAQLSLSWIRRTRVEGDAWPDTGDVPLGEVFERYLVEVGPEGAPLVSLEVSDATTVAAVDVSAVSGVQEVRVAQISETYGPGIPGRLSVSF